MDFTEQKQRIIDLMNRCDKKTIAEEAGISTVTLWKAFRKCSVAEMTPMERKGWEVAVKYISAKHKELSGLKKKTAILSQKI